jgi:hypothetical protein
MLIHAVEGLAPGKCGKIGTFDTCRSTMFSFVNQNTGLRTVRMLPLTGGRAGQLLPKKVKRIVLKHFPIKGLMILTRVKIREIMEVLS